MNGKALCRCGVAGSVAAALCCFTPLLVLLLGALGLSAWLGWADYVLLPSLGVFLGLTAYGLHQMKKERRAGAAGPSSGR